MKDRDYLIWLHSRLETVHGERSAIARRGEDLGETLVWHRSFTELPDDDTTVLVQSPNGSEPVWPGFHDERGWHHVENAVATITATAWAEMPTGPIA